MLQFIGAGADGKSRFFDLLRKTFGDYIGEGVAAMIMGQGVKDSSGARPDLLKADRKRIMLIPECTDETTINSGEVKKFTGEEFLVGRPLWEAGEARFRNTATWIVSTNHFLNFVINPTDDSMERRMELINCKSKFYDSQAAYDLNKYGKEEGFYFLASTPQDLAKLEEQYTSVLLSTLVEIQRKKETLRMPPAFEKMRDECLTRCNFYKAFYIEGIQPVDKPNGKERFVEEIELYRVFTRWMNESGMTRKIPKRANFTEAMEVYLKKRIRNPERPRDFTQGWYIALIEFNNQSNAGNADANTTSQFPTRTVN